jgi:hypothetical protein
MLCSGWQILFAFVPIPCSYFKEPGQPIAFLAPSDKNSTLFLFCHTQIDALLAIYYFYAIYLTKTLHYFVKFLANAGYYKDSETRERLGERKGMLARSLNQVLQKNTHFSLL